jgi:hypothetical protein
MGISKRWKFLKDCRRKDNDIEADIFSCVGYPRNKFHIPRKGALWVNTVYFLILDVYPTFWLQLSLLSFFSFLKYLFHPMVHFGCTGRQVLMHFVDLDVCRMWSNLRNCKWWFQICTKVDVMIFLQLIVID